MNTILTHRSQNRWLLLLVTLLMFAGNDRMNLSAQDQEPEDRFQLEFLTVEQSTGSPPNSKLDSRYFIYDLTNGVAKATNVTVWEDLWKAVYLEDWETNLFSWTIDSATGELTDGTWDWSKHSIARTNFIEMVQVVTPAKTEQTNTTSFTYTDVTPNPKGASGNQGTVDGKKYKTTINFIPKGTYATNGIKRVYRVSATVINKDTGQQVPYTDITVLGQQLNTNGVGFAVLLEGSTNKATPTVADNAAPNHTFSVSVSRVMIGITVRTSGDLVDPDWYGIGYDSALWTQITTNYFHTLGPGSNPAHASIFVLTELAAVVPSDMPRSGWKWHRDAARRAWLWNSGTKVNAQIFAEANKDFTGPPGSDTGGTVDETPDDLGRIFDVDAVRNSTLDPAAPQTTAQSIMATNTPNGSIIAFRFFAREWLEWNGGVISEIKHYHAFSTWAKDGEEPNRGLYQVGKNEFELTAPDANTGIYDDTPQFSVDANGNPN